MSEKPAAPAARPKTHRRPPRHGGSAHAPIVRPPGLDRRPPPGFDRLPQHRPPQEQKQKAPKGETSPSEDPHACVVCYHPNSYYSVGPCNHPVCFECSTRMRVLLEKRECPICRQEMGEVLFAAASPDGTPPPFALSPRHLHLPKWGIYIEGSDLKSKFDELLENRCTVCGQVEADWEKLARHVAKEHSLYPCGLCTEHLKLLPSEHHFYSRQDLASHIRTGTPSPNPSTSSSGHPPCQFCPGKRFYDNDELFKHLRRDHYYCHFCDADGYNFYYNSYAELRVHFRMEHWLCEEGECREEMFTSVWRSEVDWRAHLATAHSRLLGKHGARQIRNLDVNFNLPERQPRGASRAARGPTRQVSVEPVFATEEAPPQPKVDTGDVAQFPTLNGDEGASSANATVPTSAAGLRSAATWSGRLNKVVDEFPALSLEEPAPRSSNALQGAGWGRREQAGPVGAPATASSSRVEDFPTLASSRPSSSQQWGPKVKTAAKSSTSKSNSKVPAPAPELDFVPLPVRANKAQKIQKKKPAQPPPPPLPTSEELHLQLLMDGAVPLPRRDREEEEERKRGGAQKKRTS